MSSNVSSVGVDGRWRENLPLGQQGVERFTDRADADELAVASERAAVGGIDVRLRHDAAAESHLCGLAYAQRRLRDAAHLAGQSHLAEHRGRLRGDTVAH